MLSIPYPLGLARKHIVKSAFLPVAAIYQWVAILYSTSRVNGYISAGVN
jgi:hypothetical protein